MKIRYPKHRRSPIHHTVDAHKREGYSVQSYERGKGYRVPLERISDSSTIDRMTNFDEDTPMGPKSYTVNFSYSDKEGESVVVIADSYEKAMAEAFEERKDSRTPVSVDIVDPDLGTSLKLIGERAKSGGRLAYVSISKAAKVGAKYAIRGGKRIGKAAALAGAVALTATAGLAVSQLKRARVLRLLKQAYSDNKPVRTLARAKLRKDYPDVYAVCDFSKDRKASPRKKVTITF